MTNILLDRFHIDQSLHKVFDLIIEQFCLLFLQ